MNNIVSKIAQTYFAPSLDLRIQAFNLLAFAGFAAGIFGAFTSFMTGMSINVVVNLFTSAGALAIVHYASRKNCYLFCYRLTVIVVFCIIFPFMFFKAGGYHSGMPSFFVFALVYTALMLAGRDRIIAIAAELLIYNGVFLIAYFHPNTVTFFETETDLLIDTIVSTMTSSILLFMVIILYIRIYNNRQNQLEGLNKLKTEFLQDISHEMRNPLTTITTGIDYANNCLKKTNGAMEVYKALKIVQDEAMRLGRMVAGMVKLVSISGNTESREKIDFSVMLKNCAEMFRLPLEKKGNVLYLDIAPNLPFVYGESDRITQVLVNLLSNASKNTQNGQVKLEVSFDSSFVTVRVSNSCDDSAIELLPYVFLRGTSEKDGSGFGLPICQTIVEAHGGSIEMKCDPGKGAVVTFTIPVYGGQSETNHE